MTQSARFRAPFIQAAQVDKSTTHNEALAVLDIAASAAVDGFLVDMPPVTPSIGDCYILGASPTGAWSGHAFALAGYTAGGWRFIAAIDGLSAFDKTSGQSAVFTEGAWELGHVRAAKVSIGGNQIVGPQQASVSNPSGGATVDAEARAAITAILTRMRQHGLIAS
jgi:hypothetical protein